MEQPVDAAPQLRTPTPVVSAAVALLAIVLAGGAAWWWSQGRPSLPLTDLPIQPVVAMSADSAVTVYVSGRVATPGLVAVPSDGRVADAIAAAGGALEDAHLAGVNLAAPVRDGEHIVVVGASDADAVGAGTLGDGRVRVNSADVVAMQQLPGVGPVLAERIVNFRNEAGPFDVAEDLLDVPGIGEQKLAGMRDAIVVP